MKTFIRAIIVIVLIVIFFSLFNVRVKKGALEIKPRKWVSSMFTRESKEAVKKLRKSVEDLKKSGLKKGKKIIKDKSTETKKKAEEFTKEEQERLKKLLEKR